MILTNKKAYIFSAIYAAAIVIGRAIYNSDTIAILYNSISHMMVTLFSFATITLVLGALLSIISSHKKNYQYRQIPAVPNSTIDKILHCKGHLLIFWCFIFLSWIPCYISYFPGIFSYDINTQTWYVINGLHSYTRHHPPLHTMIWGIFYSLEQFTGIKATASYGLVQMLILSLSFALFINWLLSKNINWKWILGTLIFLSFNPVIAIMSLIPTKDVYFAITFMWYSINYAELLNSDGKINNNKQCICFIASAILMCLFRNNAIYVLVLSIIPLFIIFRKKKTNFETLFITSLAIYIFINGIVFTSLHIKEGNSREMLSIPMQQISRVVVKNQNTLDETVKEKINTFIPYDQIIENYNPRFADPIKNIFITSNMKQNSNEFLQLYFSLFTKHPKDYIDAALELNIPYWYPFASAVDSYSKRTYIETWNYDLDYYHVERKGYLPTINSMYQKVASFDAFKAFPPLAFIFSLSLPIWLIFFCGFILDSKGYTKSLLYFLPSALLWLTFMAGPVSNFRYIFPLVVLYPLYLICAIKPGYIFDKTKG